jgi:DNA polymerase-3 subunit epsilon
VKDHFLVIDTETSGLPKNWELPYDVKNNWPHVIQIAWIIFDKEGNEIKRENHYLKSSGFKITKTAIKIHKITLEFLKQRGKDRIRVMRKLASDVHKYNPLVIAHFVELDFHMVNSEFFKAGIESEFKDLPLFCTMKASVKYVKNPSFKYLKLNRFYKTLFNKRPENLHNALSDAELTAEIFFHLLNEGEVSDEIILKQKAIAQIEQPQKKQLFKWLIPALITILLLIIIWLCYEY